MKPPLCVVSFSRVAADGRVLRQIAALGPHFDVWVVGMGPRPESVAEGRWTSVAYPRMGIAARTWNLLLLLAGRIVPRVYERWYWRKPTHQEALRAAEASGARVYLANDWPALPIAVRAAEARGAKAVVDLHEYGPLEIENSRLWVFFMQKAVIHVLKRYLPRTAGSITISPEFARRYGEEFGIRPIVMYNAPELVEVEPHEVDPGRIRLVHHGGAIRMRKLERMIDAVARAGRRFELHFMLQPFHDGYLEELREHARRAAPDRVHFHEPVKPGEIVTEIARYDMGIFLAEPNSYNNVMILPNKLFEYMAAGLAVCVGPSPAMAALIREHGFGCVSPAFRAEDVAATLDALTPGDLARMRAAAREASRLYHAGTEMPKLVVLVREIPTADE